MIILNEVAFSNVVSNQEPDIANPGTYINTVSMDVILGPGINNLNGLHIDLNGVGTGVGLITPLDGVTINGSTSPAYIDGLDVRGSSSHVVVDSLATSGWDGGPAVTLKFVNLPDSYTDGSMSPESMVSSLIREEYIQTNSDDGWVTLSSLGYLFSDGGDSGSGSGSYDGSGSGSGSGGSSGSGSGSWWIW